MIGANFGATMGVSAGRAAATVGAHAAGHATGGLGASVAEAMIDGAIGGAAGDLFQTVVDLGPVDLEGILVLPRIVDDREFRKLAGARRGDAVVLTN